MPPTTARCAGCVSRRSSRSATRSTSARPSSSPTPEPTKKQRSSALTSKEPTTHAICSASFGRPQQQSRWRCSRVGCCPPARERPSRTRPAWPAAASSGAPPRGRPTRSWSRTWPRWSTRWWAGASAPPHPVRGLGLVVGGGGVSVQGADDVEREGLELPALADSTLAELGRVTPLAGTGIRNPVDTMSMWNSESLEPTLAAVARDPQIDSVDRATGDELGIARRRRRPARINAAQHDPNHRGRARRA